MGQIVNDCISEFERIAKETEINAHQATDEFTKGFLNGMLTAHRSVVIQRKCRNEEIRLMDSHGVSH